MAKKSTKKSVSSGSKTAAAQAAASLHELPLSEYAARREHVLRTLKDSVGLVFAGDMAPSLHDGFRAHPHFQYLTGVTDEPGAVLLLDPLNPVAARRTILFLKPLDPEIEKWDGFREEISSKLKARYGVATIMRTNALARWLLEAAKRAKRFALLHPFAAHTAPVSPDLDIFRKSAERIPGSSFVDHTQLLAVMRAAKSKAELALMQRAADITAKGYEAALAGIRPGVTEFDVQEMLEHGYRTNGARKAAYHTISGGAFNATVLHYHGNREMLHDGDVILIDSGAEYMGYACDVTRTFPVNGKFTPRQREIYGIVLEAQLAAIAATRAGTTFGAIDKAARDVITKAGYGDAYFHGTGHHLGLEVHDITPEGPIPENAVITIEPGIYLPGENFGVRIEDDILVTKKAGGVNLTASIPKTIAEIERAMAR
ncbi:MAG: aminopeptidase P N-terminal domain-containing protein [Phycisphaerales bacterium]|jgi:Xaa-Pro aminopeptidase